MLSLSCCVFSDIDEIEGVWGFLVWLVAGVLSLSLHQAVCPTFHRTPRKSPTRMRSAVNRPPPLCCWGSLGPSSVPKSNRQRVQWGPELVDRHPKALDWPVEDPTIHWPDTHVSTETSFDQLGLEHLGLSNKRCSQLFLFSRASCLAQYQSLTFPSMPPLGWQFGFWVK